MKLTISKEQDYIPEFRGNRKLPAVDQIVVRYKTPTTAIKNRCKPQSQAKAISDKSGNIQHMEISLETDDVQMLKEMLVSISGCSYEDESGKETAIRSAKDLLDAPVAFEPLLKEIIKEFNSALSIEVDEKNSE